MKRCSILELIIAEKNPERLSQYEVSEPEQQVIHIRVNNPLKFMLHYHYRHVDDHDSESNKVDIPNYSNHNVFMRHCRCEKCQEQGKCFVGVPPAQWIIYMTHEKTMDWEIPFAPVFRQVPCIPPIMIESPISEVRQLTPEIHVGMEARVEKH